ncbi:Angiogenic factor with G patch and FHA domains 1 [Trichinella sp. T9]|nr:Angiogenic factor with G patch and FHA domains 1 [Trichinella sp. T9]KRX57989.1 Angiogenic factor with G patch and FHA domains 1 [Trichinella sp. T9]
MAETDWSGACCDGNSAVGSIAALVTAAALETSAQNDFEFIDILGIFYNRESGYFYKPGNPEFYHATAECCYSYNVQTGEGEWRYCPDWAKDCPFDLCAYELLLDLVAQVDENPQLRDNTEEVAPYDDEISLDAYCYGDDCANYMLQTESRITPCIRIVPENSSILKPKTLFIVTIQGATIGSGAKCDVQIQDADILNEHCRISYDGENKCYTLSALNGQCCWINDSMIAENELVKLNHADLLQIGNSVLRLHIHRGMNTCVDCEPGIVVMETDEQTNNYQSSSCSSISLEAQRKRELKRLKKEYGIDVGGFHFPSFLEEIYFNFLFQTYSIACETTADYNDRASVRRRVVGSDNPYLPVVVETSSTDRHVDSKNKGFKMLSKMGWKSGDGLGRKGDGIKEPINPVSNVGTAGLGCSVLKGISSDDVDPSQLRKRQKWSKARERFSAIEKSESSSNTGNDPRST